ncbi:MAG: hypothetical protein CM1200mP29_15040 [Verrucomicrobiota bacterium]|nr:MAG: hypothetical protein CM1200mP29_15040 [Verrucomicrobiota bacterium]
MFELPTGEPLFNIKKHSDWVMALAFSPDTVLLASGDRNGGLHIWESFTGNLFYRSTAIRRHHANELAARLEK